MKKTYTKVKLLSALESNIKLKLVRKVKLTVCRLQQRVGYMGAQDCGVRIIIRSPKAAIAMKSKFFPVVQRQMLVTCGSQARLEHSSGCHLETAVITELVNN